jgi:hypothetical protein
MAATPKTLKDCKTDVQRKALAARILKMREDGTPWDGPNGIVAQGIVSGAPQGRALLRAFAVRKGKKVATGNGIAKSYERTPEFRQAESERRTAKAEPTPPPTPKPKATPKKRTAKATK